MKASALLVLALSLTACKFNEDIQIGDLEKHAAFASCVSGCYEKVYGPAAINQEVVR